ncbi:MAG: ATP synthase F1 subunit epsilon [Clostridia bacterium]
MATYEVHILTPEREAYSGQVEKIIARTTEGDVGIYANHIDYVAGLGVGKFIMINGTEKRYAALADGFLTVSDGKVTILTDFFEWQDEIDAKRAEQARDYAQTNLAKKTDETNHLYLEMKLKKALNRISVANS